jgi:flagellar biosynthetic protein FliR
MELAIGGYSLWIEHFILIWLRVTGIFIMSPIFGRKNEPNIHKIGFSFALTYILTNTMLFENNIGYTGMFEYVFACIKELVLGLTLGYLITLFFSAALIAGELMDRQVGFGMANIFDINLNIQVPLMGNFFNFLILLVFFSLNGHHTIIAFLSNSFEIIYPGQVFLNAEIGIVIIKAFLYIFAVAIQLAIPLIAAALVLEAALGIIIRTVPQMNIFIIGIPLRVAVGLVVIFLIIPAYLKCFGGMFDKMFFYINDAFRVFI